jgi:hypothetical protein
MEPTQIEVVNYQYQIHSCRSNDIYATVRLHGKKGAIAKLIFLRETPLEIASKQDENEVTTLYYLKSELSDIVELLRCEKPIYFVQDKDNITRIATGLEPVGEDE